jgi:hypothetical protein
MDVNQIIDQLRERRGQLERAIAALDGERTPKHPGKTGNGRRHRKPMSAAAKKRIGRAMRRAWKRRKQKKG